MATYRRIKSVQLTMDIMKFLAGQVEPAPARAIAKGVGSPVETVLCHLATLEDGQFIERCGESFRLGLYIAAIRESVKKSLELTLERAQKDLNFINGEE